MSEQGLSVNRLAKAVGCDNQAVARWIKGIYYPRYYILIRLADYFGCSADYVLGLTDDWDLIKTKNPSDFHNSFEKRKNQLHLTDYAVAKRLGIGQSAVSKWRIHGQVPETGTIINLSSFFDCSVEYLLGRADF